MIIRFVGFQNGRFETSSREDPSPERRRRGGTRGREGEPQRARVPPEQRASEAGAACLLRRRWCTTALPFSSLVLRRPAAASIRPRCSPALLRRSAAASASAFFLSSVLLHIFITEATPTSSVMYRGPCRRAAFQHRSRGF